MKDFLSILSKEMLLIPHKQILLSEHTTIGVGGKALAFFPENVHTFARAYDYLLKNKIKTFILGGGSNVLPKDEEYNGIILSTQKLNHIRQEGSFLTAECGTAIPYLLKSAYLSELTGIEFLVGIPATVGGITYMNGGTLDKKVSACIADVLVWEDGKIKEYPNRNCEFGYKKSIFQNSKKIILSVTFALERSSKDVCIKRLNDYILLRKNQPKGRSMGCIFKNGENYFAGKLIEEAGLKGFCMGGAMVSKEHANFIINTGNATAMEIRFLIEKVRSAVYKKTGILLQEEVCYIP